MTTKDPSAKPGLIPNFTQQTLLYQFMTKFIEERPKIEEARGVRKYRNLFTIAPGEKTSMSFLQKLNNPNAQYLLQNVPKEILSTLQPIIELYWVSPDGKEEFLLPFNNFQDPQKFGIFNSVPGHLAVGLKDFSFDYLGTNPEEVDIKIKANLRLYFSSMDALFYEYRSKKGKHFSFSDLINRKKQVSSKRDEKSHLSYTADGFRTKISVRYLLPDDDFLREAVKGLKLKKQGVSPSRYVEEIKNAIRHSDVSFFLNLARHELDYQMDSPTMPFELSLDYWASTEVKFLSDEANLIALLPPSPEPQQEKAGGPTATTLYQEFLKKNTDYSLTLLDRIQRDQVEFTYEGRQSGAGGVFNRAVNFVGSPVGVGVGHSYYQNVLTVKDASAQKIVSEALGAAVKFNDDGEADLTDKQVQLLNDYFDLRKAVASESLVEGTDLASRREEAYTRILDRLLINNAIHRVKINPMDVQNWIEKKRTIGHNSRQKHLEKKYREEGKAGEQALEELLKSKEQTAKDYYNTAEEIIRQIKDTSKITSADTSNQRLEAQLLITLKTATNDKNPNNLDEKEIEAAKKDLEIVNKAIKQRQGLQGGALTAKQYTSTTAMGVLSAHVSGGISRNINQGRLHSTPQFEVDFLYLGDLIDAAIHTLKVLEPEKMGKYFEEQSRVILSNVEIFNPLSGERQAINIGDIPVSLELWNSLWVTRVIKPAASVYSFRTFLRDIVSRIIPNAFTQKNLAEGEIKNKVKGDVEFFSIGKGETPRIVTSVPSRTAAIQVNKSSRRNETAVVLYATSNKPANLNLNKKEDVENGIYYLDVGTEGTPIHSINFSKKSIPGYLEAKIEDTGITGDDNPRSEPYNATVTMMGNTFMRPGRYIVVRLPDMGDVRTLKSRGRLLGIGGYFMINKATNRLSEFGNRVDWKTEVELIWNGFGQDGARPQELNPFLLGQAIQEGANIQDWVQGFRQIRVSKPGQVEGFLAGADAGDLLANEAYFRKLKQNPEVEKTIQRNSVPDPDGTIMQ